LKAVAHRGNLAVVPSRLAASSRFIELHHDAVGSNGSACRASRHCSQ
jgi:hypothetical protein